MRANLRPELYNRIGQIIPFHPLGLSELQRIVGGHLASVSRKLSEDRELILESTPEAINLLSRLSYDPEYGARPATRVMQREVLSPLAELLLGDDAIPGTTIRIDATAAGVEGEEQELIFSLSQSHDGFPRKDVEDFGIEEPSETQSEETPEEVIQ